MLLKNVTCGRRQCVWMLNSSFFCERQRAHPEKLMRHKGRPLKRRSSAALAAVPHFRPTARPSAFSSEQRERRNGVIDVLE
jgi:hypothetical protein